MPRKKKEATEAQMPEAIATDGSIAVTAPEPVAPPPPPMAFALPLDTLKKAVATVSAAVATRSTLPVLGGILLACEDGRMRVAATNLELGIQVWISPSDSVPGGVVIPAKSLDDALGKLPDKPVEGLLTPATVTLGLQAGRTKFNFKGIPFEEFPLIPVAELGTAPAFKGEDFIAALKAVIPAAATDEARPILTGVYIKMDDEGELTLESADGFRLHHKVLHTHVHGQHFSVVVPARALAVVVKKFIGGDTTILMDIPKNSGQVIFAQGETQIVSQLIEGSFPDLNAVIPKSHTVELKLPKTGLIKSLEAADVMAREAAHTVRIKPVLGTDTEPGHLEIVATSAETGDFHDSDLAVYITRSTEDKPFEFAVNGDYMAEMLKCSPDEQAVIELSSQTAPIKLTATDFVAVCMPMHLGR